MPSTIPPDANRNLALAALDVAFARRHAAHSLGLWASRPDPHGDPAIAAQRSAILKIAVGLIEKDFETEMDVLAEAWLTYREATTE